MIIGLTGLKGSGKDTVAAYLVKQHGFERRSFAEPLKRSMAAFLDIPYWDIEKFKDDPSVFVTVGYKNEPDKHVAKSTYKGSGVSQCDECSEWLGEFERHIHGPDHMWSPIREHTFREALQRYGTESHRDVFGHDFWVEQTLPVRGFYNGRAIAVTDVRFQNEANRIKELNGFIVRVNRPDPSEQDPHSSEVEQLSIKVDHSLNNDSDVLDLYERVERLLDKLGAEV